MAGAKAPAVFIWDYFQLRNRVIGLQSVLGRRKLVIPSAERGTCFSNYTITNYAITNHTFTNHPKNLSRSSALGNGQVSCFPNHLYRFLATTPYPQSRTNRGIYLIAATIFHILPSSSNTNAAASDLSSNRSPG